MAAQSRSQAFDASMVEGSRPDHLAHQPPQTFSVWLTSRDAAAYVGNTSVKAFYAWRDRHFIVPRSNGTVARRDLDRALNAKRAPRRMAEASLANLRKRVG